MKPAAAAPRALPRVAPRLPPRLRRVTIAALVAAVALTTLHYAWLRDSSLVQVRDVTVVGLSGPDAERVRKRLTETGLQMTTLHVREDELRQAVASEPSIRAIHATPDFPHGLRVDVTENHAVAAIDIPGSGRVPIAGNGTLMPGLESKASVPQLRPPGDVRVRRDGTAAARLSDKAAAPLVRIAAAAPPALLGRAASVEIRGGEGIVVVMRDGPRVMFGDETRAAEKWRAAAGVLASKNAQGAAYVDVRMPDRPVAGGLAAQGAVPAAAVTPPTEPAAPPTETEPGAPSTPAAGSTEPAAPETSATPQPVPAAPDTTVP